MLQVKTAAIEYEYRNGFNRDLRRRFRIEKAGYVAYTEELPGAISGGDARQAETTASTTTLKLTVPRPHAVKNPTALQIYKQLATRSNLEREALTPIQC